MANNFPSRIFLIYVSACRENVVVAAGLCSLTRSMSCRLASATSTLVSTKIVRLPCGSIFETSSVTLLRSASTLPSRHTSTHSRTNGHKRQDEETLNAEDDGVRIRHVAIRETCDGTLRVRCHADGFGLSHEKSRQHEDSVKDRLFTLMIPGRSTSTIR